MGAGQQMRKRGGSQGPFKSSPPRPGFLPSGPTPWRACLPVTSLPSNRPHPLKGTPNDLTFSHQTLTPEGHSPSDFTSSHQAPPLKGTPSDPTSFHQAPPLKVPPLPVAPQAGDQALHLWAFGDFEDLKGNTMVLFLHTMLSSFCVSYWEVSCHSPSFQLISSSKAVISQIWLLISIPLT